MSENQPYPPQSTLPSGFAPLPPPGFVPQPDYTYGTSLSPPPAPNVIVEPQPNVIIIMQDQIPDRMIVSILSTFFCPIIGLYAIFKANRANNLKHQPGGLRQARRDAASAEKFAIVAFIVGSLVFIIAAILTFVVGLKVSSKIYRIIEGPVIEKDSKTYFLDSKDLLTFN